jgi:hypothetical protein
MEIDHRQHVQHSAAEADEAAMAELLDLDAEVLHSYVSEVTTWIQTLAAELAPAGCSTWAAEPVPGRSRCSSASSGRT